MKTSIKSHELLNEQESDSALLVNCVKDLDRKFGNYLRYLPVLVNIYASMIIRVMRRIIFFSIFFFNKNSIRKKMKTTTKTPKYLNSQESNGALLADCVRDLGRKYSSYLNKS